MPEGHTAHLLAREHDALLAGHAVAVDSPQGRFAAGATRLDGRRVLAVDAHGKHLFYRWDADLVLHVHLGLFGKFRAWHRGDAAAPAPTPATRLRMRTDTVTLHLAGPTVCEVIDPAGEDAVRARLGPDPLRPDAEPEAMWTALRRRSTAVGAALLDQRVLAGVGNVYRAEALFSCGIHPERPARAITREEFERLWATLERMLADGLRRGRIVTFAGGEDVDGAPVAERVWVYRRDGLPCRRCGSPVRVWTLAARRIYACPHCQRRSAG